MKRLFCLSCLFLLLFSFSLVSAAERVPLKVLRVPVVAVGWMQPSKEALADFEGRIGRALHVPLNGVLRAVEFMPREAAEKVFLDTYSEAGGKKVKWRELVKPLALKTDADLVLLPVLTGYEQYQSMRWDWRRGTFLHSYASWELCLYDARTDMVIRKEASRSFNDCYSARGSAAALASEALDAALREAKVHELIWPDLQAK